MFNRQKALLAMIQQAGRPVQRMELTKWAFILRHETKSEGGPAFFDFVPYHYGPFSFALYQEASKLESQGYLTSDGDAWNIGTVVAPAVDDRQTASDIGYVVGKCTSLTTESLLDSVYQRHPKYTIFSKRKRLAKRPVADIAVYTSGYEGMSIDGFLNRLTETGIRHLIDVRCNPIARRYGFHKSTLKRLCESLDIRYSHAPEVGIRSEQRQSLETQQDYEDLFATYRATTLTHQRGAIDQVCDWVRECPSVLVCMEAEPCRCHRSHLAEAVSKLAQLPVHHLV